jgi:hypothetical protein
MRVFDDWSALAVGESPAGLAVDFGSLGSAPGGIARSIEGYLRVTLNAGFGGGRADVLFTAAPSGALGETVEMAVRFRASSMTPQRPMLARHSSSGAFALFVRGDTATPFYSASRLSEGLGSTSTSPFPYLANTWYDGVLRIEGGLTGSHVVRAKVWPMGGAVPSGWGSEMVYASGLGGTSKSGKFGFSIASNASGGVTLDLAWVGFATGGASAPRAPLDVYQGYRLLQVEPDRPDDPPFSGGPTAVLLDSPTGASRYREVGVFSAGRQLSFFLSGRSEIAAFRAWLAARSGRQGAFWVPTWNRDLELAADAAVGATYIDVLPSGYPSLLASEPGRRHLALIAGGMVSPVGVASASSQEGYDRLVLSTPLDGEVKRGSTDVSFLALCRMEADAVDFGWNTTELAEVTLGVSELLHEAPAP